MGKIIPLPDRNKMKAAFESDFTGMLKNVAEIRRDALGEEDNGIFHITVSFEDFFRAKIGAFIINHRLLNADLFRCSLYVSNVLGQTLSKKITSFYITDYLIRGIEEEDPDILKEGADLCCIICIFFEERRNWRMTQAGDYVKMGIQLYSLYYSMTRKLIAGCMSRNFQDIITITRKCVEDMERKE
ncbi:MAG TPA: hypothetical protein VJW95_00690 [Dissulfurispiraceae bacterium]|nr:hypothetical protein [Dissulfurispiraceae bacterium]